MIKSIDISNYQSHKETHLELSEGTNIIYGSSDCGKTAILRALRLVVWNRPGGDEFRSHWAKNDNTSVEIVFDDIRVKRVKGNTANSYYLGESEFNAFGTDVPTEIADKINLNDINLQRQLDSPFLLSNTPGEVAQYFNKIAHLDKIDTTLQKINSKVSELNIVIGKEATKDKPSTGLVKQINDKVQELSLYDNLEKFEIEVEILEETTNSYNNKLNRHKRLSSLITELSAIHISLNPLQEVMKMDVPVNELLSKIGERDKKRDKVNILSRLIAEYKAIQESLEYHKSILPAEKRIAEIQNMLNKHSTKRESTQILTSLIESIENTTKDIELKKTALKSFEEEFKKEMPDICPLCETNLKTKP